MIGDFVYINGQYFAERDAKISVFDHCFIYGDGVFEGLQAANGAIFRLDAHMDRLYRSAKYMEIEIPLTRGQFISAILETAQRNNLREGYMRPVVSRGAGPVGLRNMEKLGPPTVVIIVQHETQGKHTGSGVAAHVTSIRRVPSECLDSRVKSCNYINNILAYLEARHCGAETAIMLDLQGNVSEGYANNIFAIDGDTVVTPPLTNVLAGVTRGTIIELCCSLGIPVRERSLTVYDLITGSEAFESSTLGEIVPIASVDGQTIGTTVPGPVTSRLHQELRRLIDGGVQSTRIYND